MYSQEHREKPELPACGFCGRVLRGGYHFNCHLCGANYCYNHAYHHRDAHRCPRCSKVFPPQIFMEHIQGCDGKSPLSVTIPS